jgi:hypothetical protein
VWGDLQGKTLLLAVITPFRTTGEDASIKLTYYKDTVASIVTDIRNVKSLVGRCQTRGKSGIIDRSLEHARAVFDAGDIVPSDESEEEGK